MYSSAGAYPLALCTCRDKKTSDDRLPCLENPRPEGAESTLTENAAPAFQAEPEDSRKLCGLAARSASVTAKPYSKQTLQRGFRKGSQS